MANTHPHQPTQLRTETRRQAGVSTAFPLATDAAARVLKRGGNAVDAAVAAAWALSVCEPSASGLGGQTTLLLLASSGQARAIDGHSRAPRKVSRETVSSGDQRRGYRSCTIPSTPATLQYAHSRYGCLPWAELLGGAIDIAEHGYELTPLQSRQIGWVEKHLLTNPAASKVFFRNGARLQSGEVLRQPRLAATLRAIAEHGAEIFYTGDIARAIAADMRENGGLLDEADLENSTAPVERAPLTAKFRGLEVTTVPPPGGGLQLLLSLKIFEHLIPSVADQSVESWYEAAALATLAAFTARDELKTTRTEAVPDAGALFDEDYICALARRVSCPTTEVAAGCEEPGDTTHLTVADDQGNAVALTQSIQSVFGAKVANGRLGFIYNNYLRTCPRRPCCSQLAPNCLPRSNAAPVFVTRETPQGKEPVLALGSAGSRRIISSLLQVISGVVDRHVSVQQAIAAPRIHGLKSRKVWLEKSIASPSLIDRLGKFFPKIVIKADRNFAMGAVHALEFAEEQTLAGADPRRDGSATVVPCPAGARQE